MRVTRYITSNTAESVKCNVKQYTIQQKFCKPVWRDGFSTRL